MNFIGNDIIKEIEIEIKRFGEINSGKKPSYILINEKDTDRLLQAMHKEHLIPDTKPPKKLILFSQRVIRTQDIPENNFDVVGG